MRRTIFVWFAALAAVVPSYCVERRPWEPNSMNDFQNRPLPIAQQSLLVARSRVVEHCYSEAIRPLIITAQALAFVEAQEVGRPDGFGGSAGWVRQEILNYTTTIETNNANAVYNIDAWLSEISWWMERRKQWGIPPAWNATRHPRRLQ